MFLDSGLQAAFAGERKLRKVETLKMEKLKIEASKDGITASEGLESENIDDASFLDDEE